MSHLVLDATTKTIVAVMSGAPATTQPDFVCTWADNDGTTFTEGSSDGALTGVTQATLIAAPAASTRRIITGIRIENRDTADVTITVKYNNNGTLRTLAALTFSPGEVWTLDGTYDANGALMTAEATTQGLGTGDSPQFAGVNIGHASDTTLTRVSAGVAAVEGKTLAVLSSTQTFSAAQTGSITALTDGANIATDLALNNFFSVTLAGNRTLDNPTNMVPGQAGAIFITQDATGSRSLAYGSYWDSPGGAALTLSTAANSVDRLDYVVRTTTSIHTALTKAIS